MGDVPWAFPMKPVPISGEAFLRLRAEDYALERKYDGHRALAVSNGSTGLWTRDRRPIVAPPELIRQLESVGLPPGTVLDGEIWSPTSRGAWGRKPAERCVLTFWDAVRVGGRDLSREPLEVRRRALEELLRSAPEDVRIVEPMEATKGNLDAVEAEARSFRRETAARSGFIHGVVLKRRGSPRRDHAVRCVEHPDWLKVVFPGIRGWETRT